jgi:hypothetical protein
MQSNATHPASVEIDMTNKDSNPPGARYSPTHDGDTPRPGAKAQPAGAPYREGEQPDPRNTRGSSDQRTRAQGRGNDADPD